jgi:hypothetical protein
MCNPPLAAGLKMGIYSYCNGMKAEHLCNPISGWASQGLRQALALSNNSHFKNHLALSHSHFNSISIPVVSDIARWVFEVCGGGSRP